MADIIHNIINSTHVYPGKMFKLIWVWIYHIHFKRKNRKGDKNGKQI